MPRLQSLKRYEGIRSREKMYCDGQPKAMAEAVYCADALMLLQDETCFRMAFNYCPFPDSPKMDSEDPRQAAAQGRSAHVQVTLVDMPFYCPPDGPGCGPPADFEVGIASLGVLVNQACPPSRQSCLCRPF